VISLTVETDVARSDRSRLRDAIGVVGERTDAHFAYYGINFARTSHFFGVLDARAGSTGPIKVSGPTPRAAAMQKTRANRAER